MKVENENIHISSLEQTLKEKERFNPYQTGHGILQSKKHKSRAKEKQDLRKELQDNVL